ncbi:altronate hydrolase [Bacillus sp. TS-2]|nr:altronate hydrolase [Bacillus sp. TS-2]
MENSFTHSKVNGVVMNKNDNVITLLNHIKKGEKVIFFINESYNEIEAKEEVPFGHKLSLVEIQEGEIIRKYGESIGKATVRIQSGYHVHTHNLIGMRGRGDQRDEQKRGL